MHRISIAVLITALWVAGNVGAASVSYDFNDYDVGEIDGQNGWNVYNKVPDSSAFSIIDAVGRTDAPGDKALVINHETQDIRVVSADPVRWMPGENLRVEFDFRLGIKDKDLTGSKSVMTFFMGDSLLSEKSRWQIRVELQPDGKWKVGGGLPDWSGLEFPGSTFVALPAAADVAISDWFHMIIEVSKRKEPDSFWSRMEIQDAQGNSVIDLKFTDRNDKEKAAEIWETSRLHVGFHSAYALHGLVCVDNIAIEVTR